MEKKMDDAMEAGIIWWFIGIQISKIRGTFLGSLY